jgi:Cu2+-exporting ATPase
VQAGTSPLDKLNAIKAWQAQGERVVMVGDGINDAPVLAQADVSMTLGQAAALVQNRADVVIQGAQLVDIAHVRQIGKASLRVVKQNLMWALGYNVLAVPMAVSGLLAPWAAGLGMAISSLVVVANAMRLSK